MKPRGRIFCGLFQNEEIDNERLLRSFGTYSGLEIEQHCGYSTHCGIIAEISAHRQEAFQNGRIDVGMLEYWRYFYSTRTIRPHQKCLRYS